tara:strand:- start:268 stop:537 length:270 start_codon:yes stop_codon:yes gene_type:complete
MKSESTSNTKNKENCLQDPDLSHVNRSMGQLKAVKKMIERCDPPIKVLQQAEACRKSLGSLERKLVGKAIKEAKPSEVRLLLEYLHKTC